MSRTAYGILVAVLVLLAGYLVGLYGHWRPTRGGNRLTTLYSMAPAPLGRLALSISGAPIVWPLGTEFVLFGQYDGIGLYDGWLFLTSGGQVKLVYGDAYQPQFLNGLDGPRFLQLIRNEVQAQHGTGNPPAAVP